MGNGQLAVDHPAVHPPGIYFEMPFEEYRAALALSAHGIVQLRSSPLNWWVHSPLNPELVEEETDAKIIGKAYHTHIIEGASVFRDRYAMELRKKDWPNALITKEMLAAHIIGRGGTVRSSATKADLIGECLRLDATAQIWDRIEEDHARRHEGKIFLSPSLYTDIEIASAIIQNHRQLRKAFTGGQPEVSIFWFDPATGVPCKARIDYLKPRAIVDLKTFVSRDMNPDKAIARAVATYKYHIQAAFYLRAMRHVQPKMDRTFLFVFQDKGKAPIVRGKVMAPGIALDIGHAAIEEALEKWKRCWSQWREDPWNEITDITTFEDNEFPVWMAD